MHPDFFQVLKNFDKETRDSFIEQLVLLFPGRQFLPPPFFDQVFVQLFGMLFEITTENTQLSERQKHDMKELLKISQRFNKLEGLPTHPSSSNVFESMLRQGLSNNSARSKQVEV